MASSLTHSLSSVASVHHRHGHNTSPDSFSTSTIQFHALDLSRNCNNNNNLINNKKELFNSLIISSPSSTNNNNNNNISQQIIPQTLPNSSSVHLIPQQHIYQTLLPTEELIEQNKNSVEEQIQSITNTLLLGKNGYFLQQNNLIKCPKLLSEFNNFINNNNTKEYSSLNFLQFIKENSNIIPKTSTNNLVIDSLSSSSNISSSGPDSDCQTSSNSPPINKLIIKLNDKKEDKEIQQKQKQQQLSTTNKCSTSPIKKQLVRDDAYWERRRKNNYAAKRSRDTRRRKEDEIAVRAVILEQENLRLRFELERLKTEIERYKIIAFSQGISLKQQQLIKNKLINENLELNNNNNEQKQQKMIII